MGKKNKNKSKSTESPKKADTEKDTKALSEQNLEEFLDNWDEDSDDDTQIQEEQQPVKKKEKKKKSVEEKPEDTNKTKASKG